MGGEQPATGQVRTRDVGDAADRLERGRQPVGLVPSRSRAGACTEAVVIFGSDVEAEVPVAAGGLSGLSDRRATVMQVHLYFHLYLR